MSILMITYDLHKPDEDNSYQALYDLLKGYTHYHPVESVWFLDTLDECSTVRSNIKKVLPYPDNDQIFVIEQEKHWASSNLQGFAEWLKSSNRRWS